jgi:hypothetical protein
MPLPLLLAPIVTVASSVGAMGTAVVTYIVAKVTSKALFMSAQIFVSVALIGSHVVMMGFFLYIILFVFNKYNEFLELISNMSQESEILSIAFNILQSLGIFSAFSDVFAIFSPFLLAYLIYRAGLIVYHSFQATSNELFKVVVVTQQ